MSKEKGFVPLRRGIWEHVRDGRMSHLEALAFIYICSQADTRTGIWNGSAGALAGELGIPARTARDVLEKMEHGDYIRRFAVPGKHVCYPILVHKFQITQGEHNGEQLNALESKSPAELSYLPREHGVEQVVEHGAVQRRSENRVKRLGEAKAINNTRSRGVSADSPEILPEEHPSENYNKRVDQFAEKALVRFTDKFPEKVIREAIEIIDQRAWEHASTISSENYFIRGMEGILASPTQVERISAELRRRETLRRKLMAGFNEKDYSDAPDPVLTEDVRIAIAESKRTGRLADDILRERRQLRAVASC
jgi:hypothetical protein